MATLREPDRKRSKKAKKKKSIPSQNLLYAISPLAGYGGTPIPKAPAMLPPDLALAQAAAIARSNYSGGVREASPSTKLAQSIARSAANPISVREASPETRRAQAIARSAATAPSTSTQGSAIPDFLAGINLPSLDPTQEQINDWLKRAQNAAGITYDPEINAITRSQGQAKTTAAENDKKLAAMYAALAASMQSDVVSTQQDTAASKAQNKAAYDALTAGIGSEYAKSKAEQTAQMQALGTTANAADVFAPQEATNQLLTGLAKTQGQAQADALQIVGQSASDRATSYKGMASAEGAMRQADLATELRNYLAQTSGQIADLQGAKGQLTRELTDQYRDSDFSKQLQLAGAQLDQAQFEANFGLQSKQLQLDAQEAQAKAQAQADQLAADQAEALRKSKQDEYKNAEPWQKVALYAQDKVDARLKDHPNDPQQAQDFTRLGQRVANNTKWKGNRPTLSEFLNEAHRLNSREEARNGGYRQVNPADLDDVMTQAYIALYGR